MRCYGWEKTILTWALWLAGCPVDLRPGLKTEERLRDRLEHCWENPRRWSGRGSINAMSFCRVHGDWDIKIENRRDPLAAFWPHTLKGRLDAFLVLRVPARQQISPPGRQNRRREKVVVEIATWQLKLEMITDIHPTGIYTPYLHLSNKILSIK